jgi:hypothetical protein
MQVDRRLHIGQQSHVVIHSLTAHIGQFKHCNSLVHFFLWGANVFTLGSNKYYFCLQNCALPEDLHSLRGSTCDLWIIYSVSDRVISEWWWIGKDLVESGHGLILRYCPGMRLEGLRKTTKNVNQDSRSPGPRFETRTSWIRSRSLDHDVWWACLIFSSGAISKASCMKQLWNRSVYGHKLNWPVTG